MSQSITANEVKTKGISSLAELIAANGEAFISVRGKNKFVVIPIEKYNELKECEIESALAAARRDLENGKYSTETVDGHIEKIKNA